MADLPVTVGVRLLRSSGEHADVPVYRGVAYCDAVTRAGNGEALRVLPGSIETCRWAPVVLGLKEPGGRFERRLAPRLPFPTAGLLLAPLERFRVLAPGEPEVVIVRGAPELLGRMAERAGEAGLWAGHEDSLARSALPLLAGGRVTLAPLRRGLIGAVNQALAPLACFGPFQALTRWLFRSEWVTASFDLLISHTLADMSVCRNSTVVPLLTGRANLSFFCTGGITWGANDPGYLTSGWPWHEFERAFQGEGAEPLGRGW
jgi:uncharacterized protein (DUF169 family)